MTFDRETFERDRKKNAQKQSLDGALQELAMEFLVQSDQHGYAYQWTWLGLPIIQLPADILAIQEIIWTAQPDVIIETGVAWGGSVALYASLFHARGRGKVIGVDLNLYEHVAETIMALPVADHIHLIKGDSTSESVIEEVKKAIEPRSKVMVVLDSNHTHAHVLSELRGYGPLISEGQYLVVSDTVLESMPPQEHRPRSWGPGDNPKTALDAYLKETDSFEEDTDLTSRLLTSFNPGGYLRRVR